MTVRPLHATGAVAPLLCRAVYAARPHSSVWVAAPGSRSPRSRRGSSTGSHHSGEEAAGRKLPAPHKLPAEKIDIRTELPKGYYQVADEDVELEKRERERREQADKEHEMDKESKERLLAEQEKREKVPVTPFPPSSLPGSLRLSGYVRLWRGVSLCILLTACVRRCVGARWGVVRAGAETRDPGAAT